MLDHLLKLLKNVEIEIQLNESVIDDCQRLFKPWPVKKKKEEKGQRAVADVSQQVDVIPELGNVRKALEKAEKTRNKFSKNLQQVSPHPRVQTTNISATSLIQYPQAIDDLNCNNNASSSDESKKEYEYRVGRNQNLGPHRYPNSQARSSGQRGNMTEVTSKKYVAVHATAPYQTATSVKRVKPGKTKAQQLRENANKLKSSQAINVGGRTVRSSSVGQLPKTRSRNAILRPFSENLVNTKSDLVKNLEQPLFMESEKYTSSVSTDDISNDFGLQSAEITAMASNKQPQEQHVVKTDIVEKSEFQRLKISSDIPDAKEFTEERFELSKHGKQLRLPAKYCKLKQVNRKLREKLQSIYMTKPVTTDGSGSDSFMNRMNNYFCSHLSEQHLSHLQSMNNHAETYNTLQRTFHDIRQQNLSETSDWEDVLIARKKMQTLLQIFVDLEADFHDANFALEREKSSGRNEAAICAEPELPTCEIKRSTYPNLHWTTDYFANRINLTKQTTFELRYRNEKELLLFTRLCHDLQLLALKLQIMDDVAQTEFTLTRQLIKEGDFSSAFKVYRVAYCLLCGKSRTFPALVRDIEDATSTYSCHDENDF